MQFSFHVWKSIFYPLTFLLNLINHQVSTELGKSCGGIFTARKRSLRGYVFTGVCLSTWGGRAWLLFGVHGCSWGVVRGCSRGACMVAPGWGVWLLPGGHMWLLLGGMHGCSWGGVWLLRGWGACVVAPIGACVVAPGGHAWLLPGGLHGCFQGVYGCSCWGGMHGYSWGEGGHAWDTIRYGDTINEQAVRILLECILVVWVLTAYVLS